MFFKYPLWLLPLLMLFGCAHSQTQNNNLQNEIDSLANYSYLIGVPKHDTLYWGTGFFYKKNNDLFLTSNAHILRGIDPIHYVRLPDYPDFVYIRLKNKITGRYTLVRLDITIEKNYHLFWFYNEPDLCIYPLINSIENTYFINVVDKYISRERHIESPDSLVTYGFPIDDTKHYSENDLNTLHPTKNVEKFFEDVNIPLYYTEINKFDSINVRIAPGIPKGSSGSPLYAIYKNHISLVGIIFGESEGNNQFSMVVRANYLY